MKKHKHLFFLVFFLSILLSGQIILYAQTSLPIVGNPPQKVEDDFILEPPEYQVETWIENLFIPWELVFLSENRALVNERAGLIRLIENGILQETPYKIINEVTHVGEGGLMGLAKHPQYPQQKYLYIMYTYSENNEIFNRVVRYHDLDNTMEFD
ncbi:MAG: PQQ-dependent sugar dehydrogenase, partial [Atribacterota bacterium]|nr:PQQ-dependent sugar dehydrogenase [Atribacterota bacterium]